MTILLPKSFYTHLIDRSDYFLRFTEVRFFRDDTNQIGFLGSERIWLFNLYFLSYHRVKEWTLYGLDLTMIVLNRVETELRMWDSR